MSTDASADDGVEGDDGTHGVERDRVERDGVERDRVERDRVERDGVPSDVAVPTQPVGTSSQPGDAPLRSDGEATRSDGEATQPAAPGRIDPRLGWALVAALTLVVFLTWMPSLSAPFGDNHEGRILGRHALHVTNAWEHGIAGSGWLSDASPYSSTYAHHPPLMNLAYYTTSSVLPGELSFTLRLFAYLSGVAMLPVGAALLRRLGFSFWPVLLSGAAMAVTPLFWSYGRLHGYVTLLLAMALFAVRLSEDRDISRGELIAGCVLSVAAIVSSYLGLATGALLGLWVLTRRGFDRITITLGASMALGALITLAYVVGNTGAADVGAQVEFRTSGGDFTRDEFHERIARWREELLPTWWRQGLAWVALVAGLADRRTRVLVAITGVVALGYIYGLPNGSFVHDYWILPLLLPVWLGTAAAASYIVRYATVPARRVILGAASAALVLAAIGLLRGDVPDEYFRSPEDVGELVSDRVGPGDDQEIAWAVAIGSPRWLSFYWDLRYVALTDEVLDELQPSDTVIVRLDRTPEWLGERDDVVAAATEVIGIYAALDGATVHELADDAS